MDRFLSVLVALALLAVLLLFYVAPSPVVALIALAVVALIVWRTPRVRRAFFLVLAVPFLACALSGCALNASNVSAATGFVNALSAAGCSGQVHASVTATTAAMGVPSASVTNTFDGSCNPGPKLPPTVTIPAG